MDATPRKPWTQSEFLSWAESQSARYEFDGFHPEAMTGGSAGHAAIGIDLRTALRNRLRGKTCRPLGPDAGIETVDGAVRYPDALVTCATFDLLAKTIPGVVVVFEVLSPTSGRIDRIVKTREYAAVPSIRRYVILGSTGVGATVMERASPQDVERLTALNRDDVLRMPEIAIEIPVAEFYEDIAFPTDRETSHQETGAKDAIALTDRLLQYRIRSSQA